MKRTRHIDIHGMTCQMCVKHVTNALNAVEGLTVKDVSIGSAVVESDSTEVSDDRICEALRETGYEARVAA